MAKHYVLIVSRQVRDSSTNQETTRYRKIAGPLSQREAMNACTGYGNDPKPFECDEEIYQDYLKKDLIDE